MFKEASRDMISLKDYFKRHTKPVPPERRQQLALTGSDVPSQVRAVLEQAEQSKPLLAYVLRGMSKRFHVPYKLSDTKSFRRALAKVNVDYDGDATRLCDACRGMIVVNDNDAQTLIRIANFLRPSNNRHTVSFADKISEPAENGFAGLNVKYRMPNGHIAEIMVLTHSMAKVYDRTHELMERAGAIVRRCVADGMTELPPDLGKRVHSFNVSAAQLHDHATRKALALVGYSLDRRSQDLKVA